MSGPASSQIPKIIEFGIFPNHQLRVTTHNIDQTITRRNPVLRVLEITN